MKIVCAVAVLTAACSGPSPQASGAGAASPAAHDSRVAVAGAELFAREVGQGRPMIVLHGGPDFDHTYFLPEMDRFADGYRLIYYDQRGRGKSAAGVKPEDVTIESEMADLEKVRQHFQLDSPVVVGHSLGDGPRARVRAALSRSRVVAGAHEPGAGLTRRLPAAPAGADRAPRT